MEENNRKIADAQAKLVLISMFYFDSKAENKNQIAKHNTIRVYKKTNEKNIHTKQKLNVIKYAFTSYSLSGGYFDLSARKVFFCYA